MNNKEIEIFLVAYEKKSISKAARELFFTKQNVSTSLMNFENEFGKILFKRDSRGLQPTEECHKLYNIIKNLKVDIGNLEEYYTLKKNPYSVRIADNNFQSIAGYFNRALEKYSIDSVLYSYENEEAQEIYNMLLNKKCEIGIFAIPKELESDIRKKCELHNIQLEFLLESDPCIVVKETHPLANLDIITPKDLKEFRRLDIIRPSGRDWYFNKYLSDNNISINSDMKTNSISNIYTVLKLTEYYFIGIHSKNDEDSIQGLKMIPFKESGLRIQIFLGYNKEANFDNVAEHFMELVRGHYKDGKFKN